MSDAPAVTAEAINAYIDEAWPGSTRRCTAVGDGWAEARLEVSPSELRPGEIVSGPTLFALVDAVLWYALFTRAGIEPMALTSEMSIRYLKPARGRVVVARADLDHAGRRSVIGTIRCWMEDAPDVTVAVAQGTYVRPRG